MNRSALGRLAQAAPGQPATFALRVAVWAATAVLAAFAAQASAQSSSTRAARPAPAPAVPAASAPAAGQTAAGALAADQTGAQPPALTQHPALFLVGDSIVRTGVGTGETGPWGWGAELIPMFDPAKIHVYNEGLGGRSSRGYIQEGAWAKILARIEPGDWVIVQFGHNDAANSQNYPDRTTLPGDGDEPGEIVSPVTHQPETIHSYGWYLREYVREAKARGASVIVCSPPPRDKWVDGKIVRGLDGYAGWAKQAAGQSGAYFLDLNTLSADKYDALGQEKTQALFNDFQHSRKAGARLNAESVAEGIRALKLPLAADLLPLTLPPQAR